MTAIEYDTEVLGEENMRLFPRTENETLQELIASHRRLREYNAARADWWRSLPRWKVWIAKWLRVT